jgi:plastocyanin
VRQPAALIVSMLLATVPAAGPGQSTLERTSGLPETWTGIPWSLELGLFTILGPDARDVTPGLAADPAVRAALALPGRLVAELRYAPQPVETDGRDELEAALRLGLFGENGARAGDLSLEARFGTAARTVLVGGAAARWLGPIRLAGSAGALLDEEDAVRARPVAGAGAVWHPARGRAPIALTADATALLAAADREAIAWRAGVQVGVSFTPHTLSVFATNAGTSLPGRYQGTDDVRFGVELTGHVPVGRFLGRYVDRDVAREAVREAERAEAESQNVVVVPIRDYRYAPTRIEITAGTAVRWVNEDRVLHTATADNGSWNSGGIAYGESWTAVFTEPGLYPYHCGPHPYMRGVVVVR